MERRLGSIGQSAQVVALKFFLASFVANCESYAYDIKTVVLVIRVS